MGGNPRSQEVVEAWIRSKTGVTDEEEIQSMVRRHMVEMGTWKPDMTDEEIAAASKAVADLRETTGFKRDEQHGLYLEARQIKAMLKESTNVLYAGERWGATKKGPKSFLAERVFVSPDKIFLDRMEPDGVDQMIGHIVGPQGPRSTLGRHEFVQNAVITFDVLVARDAIEQEWWADIWTHAEENGLGALRSQGWGRFDIMQWDQIKLASNAPAALTRKPSAAQRTNHRTLVPA